MKSYAVNETLLGDGVGVANFVYFILSGRCQMIETIEVVVTTHLGKNYYTLYDPYVCKLYKNLHRGKLIIFKEKALWGFKLCYG